MENVRSIERKAGWVFLILGLLAIFYPLQDASLFYYLLAFLSLVSAAAFLFKAIKGKSLTMGALALLTLLLSWFLWRHQGLEQTLIIYFFAFYLFFNGVAYLIQVFLDFKESSKLKWRHLILCLVYFVLCGLSLFYHDRDLRLIMFYFGAYLLLLAYEMFDQSSNRSASTESDRLFRYWITMPVYIVVLVPSLFLRKIDYREHIGKKVPLEERKNDKEVNLRVYVHTGLSGEHIAGHMTLSHNGIMYSYGNYDAKREKFFRTIGPGVFFTVPAEVYVNNSCIYEGSTLFEFGMHLSEEQIEEFDRLVNGMLESSYRWLCPIEKEAEGHLDFKKYESDYASRLSYRTGAKFRKFPKGRWKNYWLFGDNCSVFGEYVLKHLGIDVLPKAGIITPGEFFLFFEKAYEDPNSCVITKSWHDAQYPESLFDTIA